MPRKYQSFASVAGLMIAAALSIALPAFAEPVRPDDDALVLANVPPRTAGQDDDAKTPAGQLSLDLAVQVARTAIEQGRANSDPRAYGEAEAALSNWWNETEPPEQVRMLRAVIRQASHEFQLAAADLDVLLQRAPRNTQARLSRAFLRMVTGDIDGAFADCEALPYGARGLVRAICLARAAALSGQAEKGRLVLQQALASDPQSARNMQNFAAAVLADINVGLGHSADAETLYAAAIAGPSPDVSLFAAYADLLLDADRPADVLNILEGKGEQDALLLRRAIAAKRVSDPRLAAWSKILNERFVAAAAAGNRVHLREEAMFRLDVEGDAAAALPLAVQNWLVQKEPADARLLMLAAIAVKDHEAARPAINFIATTKLDDARLRPLLAQLGNK